MSEVLTALLKDLNSNDYNLAPIQDKSLALWNVENVLQQKLLEEKNLEQFDSAVTSKLLSNLLYTYLSVVARAYPIAS